MHLNKILKTILTFILFINVFNTSAQNKQESIERGGEIYLSECISCHMENGEGIMGAFPPLAKSDYLLADTDRAIKAILEGLSGELVVNGQTYYGEMTAIEFTDKEVSDIMNYILNSWGNEGEIVKESDVKKNR
jgi:mono/diheme cytochrome c family protein